MFTFLDCLCPPRYRSQELGPVTASWLLLLLQVDSCSVNVLYENGDSEQLATSEVLRDGLLSLGWVQPEPWMPADSASCPSSEVASAAGLHSAALTLLSRIAALNTWYLLPQLQ